MLLFRQRLGISLPARCPPLARARGRDWTVLVPVDPLLVFTFYSMSVPYAPEAARVNKYSRRVSAISSVRADLKILKLFTVLGRGWGDTSCIFNVFTVLISGRIEYVEGVGGSTSSVSSISPISLTSSIRPTSSI